MRKTVKLLFAEQDRAALQPLLDELRKKGLRCVALTGEARKNDVVLAVLSEAFYADGAAVDKLLGLIAAEAENMLPLQLDGAPIPDALKNALYARNIIPTAGRDDAHTAERILSAIPPSPPVLPRALIAGGALLLALIVGALIWRSAQNKAVPSMASDLLETAVSYGLTEEDLAKIEDVVIVGDQVVFLTGEELDAAIDDVQAAYGPDDELPFIYFDVDNYAVLDENDRDGNIHWYGMDSGRELGMSSYDDLRFIGLMPNLRYLSLALVDVPADRLPDLSGADKLEGVAVLSCGVDSLSWLSGSSVRDMMIRFSPIRDFGALTACEDLRLLHVDMRGTDVEADFSAFAPPALKNAALWFVDFSAVQDLSFLSSIRGLQKLQLLDPTGLRSLSGLEGLSLEDLEIVDGFDLEDISALSRLKWLKSLSIDDCPDVRDYSPIGGCSTPFLVLQK